MEDSKFVPRLMIDGDNKAFMKSELDKVIKSSAGFSVPGLAIKVLSVIGAQNSGKSTLMNSLFGCSFDVMKAEEGIQQTTKGLWASECIIPNLLVVDVEGSDGKEQAKNDASFERKSALFALTVSDVLIFNMWTKDAGRNEGGSVPLFTTIFQERVKLEKGKTRLLFVLRGYDGMTPFDKLEKKMMDSMKEIWDEVNNPAGQESVVPFSSYIDVKVVALADAVFQKEKFEMEVAELREWIRKDGFVGFQHHKVTAAGFSYSAQELWKQIEQNKQLDLPTHREMVSGHFCGEVKRQCLASLDSHNEYLLLKSDMIETPQEFSDQMESLIKLLTDRYEAETKTYDERIKVENKKELTDEIIKITSTYASNLLTKLQSEIRRQSTQLVYNALDRNPTTEVHQLVEACVSCYMETCKVLLQRYPALLSEPRTDAWQSDLIIHARQVEDNYRKERARYEEIERMRQAAERRMEEADRAIQELSNQLRQEMFYIETEMRTCEMRREKLETEMQQAREEAEKYRQAGERAMQDAAIYRKELVEVQSKKSSLSGAKIVKGLLALLMTMAGFSN